MTSLSQVPEQSPEDIYKDGVDESKCITGFFKVLRPSSNTDKEVIVGIQSRKGVQSFRVFFRLKKTLLLKLDQLSPTDTFRLSLRGCTMEKLSQIPKSSTLPMELIYTRGLHIEWDRRASNEKETINTWPGSYFDPFMSVQGLTSTSRSN